MRTSVAIGVALGAIAGLLLLAVSQQPKNPASDGYTEPTGTTGLAVTPGVPVGTALNPPPVGVGAPTASELGVGVAPTLVGPTGQTVSEEKPSPEHVEPEVGWVMPEPPKEASARRQWHVDTVLPQWKSLNAALRRSGREQFREPIRHLVSDLEMLQGGVSEEDYRALLASEQQLVNAIRNQHPGLWPIEEPLSFLEAFLDAFEP